MNLVVQILSSRSGELVDITNYLDEFTFSNTDPGGLERATFKFKSDWDNLPSYIEQGNTIIINEGPSIVWAGRLGDIEKNSDADIAVLLTAYGPGIKLKDTYMSEIYVDRDLNSWTVPIARQRKIAYLADSFSPIDGSVKPDDTSASPAIASEVTGAWGSAQRPVSESWYDAGPNNLIKSIYYQWTRFGNINPADTNWSWFVVGSSDELATSYEYTGELRATGPSVGTLSLTTARQYAYFRFSYNSGPAASDNEQFGIFWQNVAVYGDHGLTAQGIDPKGFYASDIVSDVLSRASGITARYLEPTQEEGYYILGESSPFVIPHLVFRDPVTLEDAITEVNKFHNFSWGTWAAENLAELLKAPGQGFFEFRGRSVNSPAWELSRSQCSSVQLSNEFDSLYNQVDVVYTDVAGSQKINTISRYSPVLSLNGITRKARLDGGTMTSAGADQLGTAFLSLISPFAPARGTITISGQVNSPGSGQNKEAYHIKADGSYLILNDVSFPQDLFHPDTVSANRSNAFPIKRVETTVSGNTYSTAIEVDQTNDLLSILQARLAANIIANNVGT